MPVQALKPAPLNMHFMGYDIVLGADFVDYFFSDPISIQDHQKDMGPERIVWFPDTIMPTVRSEISADKSSREQEGLPENSFVFANFNQPFKIEPTVFDIWMNILKAVPDSVFWLGYWNETANANLRKHAASAGVDPNRLVFGNITQHPQHLARLSHADLALDTFFHGGGVTTVDCLWAGLPVVCALGDTPTARLGASIVTAHGLSDLVTENHQEYRSLAIELATDPARMAEIRQRCENNRETSVLFDNDLYVSQLESGYEQAWKRHRDGQGPEHIYLEKG